MSDKVTASILRGLAIDGAHGVVLHRCRHLGGHAEGEGPCWCEPLRLDRGQMRYTPLKDLQVMLDEFYQVH